jgi:heme-degrading monooxygenase HmoA
MAPDPIPPPARPPGEKILRSWTFWIRTHQLDECREHLDGTTLKAMRAAPGNERAAALFRSHTDGTTEVVVISLWDSMDSVLAFAGSDHRQPTIDPSDRPKLFDHEQVVRHYVVWDDSAFVSAHPPGDDGDWNRLTD